MRLQDHPIIKILQRDVKDLQDRVKDLEIAADIQIERSLSYEHHEFLRNLLDQWIPDDP